MYGGGVERSMYRKIPLVLYLDLFRGFLHRHDSYVRLKNPPYIIGHGMSDRYIRFLLLY